MAFAKSDSAFCWNLPLSSTNFTVETSSIIPFSTVTLRIFGPFTLNVNPSVAVPYHTPSLSGAVGSSPGVCSFTVCLSAFLTAFTIAYDVFVAPETAFILFVVWPDIISSIIVFPLFVLPVASA